MSTRKPAGWSDLRVRLISAAVMIVVGFAALWLGGLVWWGLVTIAATLMIWELAPLCDPQVPGTPRRTLAALTAVCSLVALLAVPEAGVESSVLLPMFYAALLLLPALTGGFWLRRGRRWFVLFALAITGGAAFLYVLRVETGMGALLILVGIVVMSDTAGYFVGRLLGGAKFWPSISPNKTWSGTVGGWVASGLFGLIFLPMTGISALVAVPLAVLLALAAQMGDIAESALKRRVGAKDASALIPGHGGLMDRFDALTAASLLAGALTLVTGA